mgnify:FL=1
MYTFNDDDIKRIDARMKDDGMTLEDAIDDVCTGNLVNDILTALADNLECEYLPDDSEFTDIELNRDDWRITFNVRNKSFVLGLAIL